LNSELDYLEEFAEDNPKNYQIWYHRRSIVEKMGHVEREIAFCNKIFEIDAKNYHCWAHR
jgi:protein farnesyltransferase/geranylgeranyltransferase type-1 subunit alpha